MLHGQFNAVTDQWFAWQQAVIGGVIHRSKRLDQANARCITPNQNRRACHQINLNTLAPLHAIIPLCNILNNLFKIMEFQLGIRQCVGQIQNWIILCLAMHTFQRQLARIRQRVKHHVSRLVYRRQLRRIAKNNQRWKNLFQVVELTIIQHGCFVHKANIQGIFTPFPSRNEIRTPQTSSGQGAGN